MVQWVREKWKSQVVHYAKDDTPTEWAIDLTGGADYRDPRRGSRLSTGLSSEQAHEIVEEHNKSVERAVEAVEHQLDKINPEHLAQFVLVVNAINALTQDEKLEVPTCIGPGVVDAVMRHFYLRGVTLYDTQNGTSRYLEPDRIRVVSGSP